MTNDSLRNRRSDKSLQRIHLLTVAVEDYFDATALNPLVPQRHRDRMESRVSDNVNRTLDLLERYEHKATFFVLGRVAERVPEVLREIVGRGHEVASKGYEHQPLSAHTPRSFREDVRQSKHVIEQAIGRQVLGFRIPQGHFGVKDLWALDVLADEGYRYDSSIYPRLRSLGRQTWRRFPHAHENGGRKLYEFPLASGGNAALLVPVAGGNYFRQLPPELMQLSFEFWHRRYTSPFNMYFHTWELDPNTPQIATAGLLTRLRQYRNLERMPEILSHFFEKYRFTSIADFGRWEQEPRERIPPAIRHAAPKESLAISGPRTPITIVVPCFNEAEVLSYLENTLHEMEDHFSNRYDVSFVLVDDCSTDDTWAGLKQRFGSKSNVKVVHHEVNRGVADAILTGIRAAETEIVCSIDADCTYDPRQLEDFIPLLADDVAMVTASPYHDDGHVVGVPSWRLVLSRNLSRIYGTLLNHRFATYTACFRVYRKSAVEHIQLENRGFLGVAEMLIQLDLAGHKLVECPATLEARLLGSSKLKTARTIMGHLQLISRIPAMKRSPRAS